MFLSSVVFVDRCGVVVDPCVLVDRCVALLLIHMFLLIDVALLLIDVALLLINTSLLLIGTSLLLIDVSLLSNRCGVVVDRCVFVFADCCLSSSHPHEDWLTVSLIVIIVVVHIPVRPRIGGLPAVINNHVALQLVIAFLGGYYYINDLKTLLWRVHTASCLQTY